MRQRTRGAQDVVGERPRWEQLRLVGCFFMCAQRLSVTVTLASRLAGGVRGPGVLVNVRKVEAMAQDARTDLIRRLKRIEGQTRGVQKMVEENRPCTDILHQLSAINEAVRSVGLVLVEEYAVECLQSPSNRLKSREAITAMLDAIARVPR